MAGELFPRRRIFVPLEADTLRGAIRTMITRLGEDGVISDPAAIEALIAQNQLRDVVAVGPHVALPHLRTDAVDRLVTALGVAPRALQTQDTGLGTAPRILALVLAPPDEAAAYLQTLAVLARLFRDEAVVLRLLEARSTDDVVEIPEVRGLSAQPRLAVRDVMTRDVRFLTPDASVREAVDIVVQQGVRAVPVVGDKGEVLGMVTDRDIMRALMQGPRASDKDAAASGSPRQVRVRDIMSRSVLCISEDLGLDEVATTMINKDVDRLPVVREGQLTGILTRGDIIRKLFAR